MKIKLPSVKCRIRKKLLACPGCSLDGKSLPGMGSLPADILFLCDAPKKENIILKDALTGDPYRLVVEMVKDAMEQLESNYAPTIYSLNGILCRPFINNPKDKHHDLNRIPFKREVLSCMGNVLYIAKAVNPKLVVFVGNLAEQYYKAEFPDAVKLGDPQYHMIYGGKGSPTYNSDVLLLSEGIEKIL